MKNRGLRLVGADCDKRWTLGKKAALVVCTSAQYNQRVYLRYLVPATRMAQRQTFDPLHLPSSSPICSGTSTQSYVHASTIRDLWPHFDKG